MRRVYQHLDNPEESIDVVAREFLVHTLEYLARMLVSARLTEQGLWHHAILALPRFYLGAWRQGTGAGSVNGTQVHPSEFQVE